MRQLKKIIHKFLIYSIIFLHFIEIMSIIKEREQARKMKDWKKSDELRALLMEKGISVKDTPEGTEWKKI